MTEETKKPKSAFDRWLPVGAVALVIAVVLFSAFYNRNSSNARDAVVYPTPKKVTAGLRGELQASIDNKLGTAGKVTQATLNAAGIYTIQWQIGDNISDSLVKRSAKNDIAAMLQYVKGAGKDYKEVNLRGHVDLTDASGNVENRQVIYVTYTKETVDNINFANFLADNVYVVADEVVNHPLFQD